MDRKCPVLLWFTFSSLPTLVVVSSSPWSTPRPYLQGRQAVVICQLLSLLITQVLNPQAEPQLLQRHRRHIVGHIIDLRVQRERWEGLRTHHTCVKTMCAPIFV